MNKKNLHQLPQHLSVNISPLASDSLGDFIEEEDTDEDVEGGESGHHGRDDDRLWQGQAVRANIIMDFDGYMDSLAYTNQGA